MKKSAWHLHGSAQIRCNSANTAQSLEQNRPFCFSLGKRCGVIIVIGGGVMMGGSIMVIRCPLPAPCRWKPVYPLWRPQVSKGARAAAFRRSRAKSTRKDTNPCRCSGGAGARISEVLALTPAAIDIESGVPAVIRRAIFGRRCGVKFGSRLTASVETLKRRRRGIVRQVPLPLKVLAQLDRVFELRIAQRDPQLATLRLWRFSRSTAWRYVKAVMMAAGITGLPAMPKGLRHGFGVSAFQSNVPPHLVQRWLGHSPCATTCDGT